MLKQLKLNSMDIGLKVLTIWRTRKEEIHLVLKKGFDVLAFEKLGVRALLVCFRSESYGSDGWIDTSGNMTRLIDVTVTYSNVSRDSPPPPPPPHSRKNPYWRSGDSTHKAKECRAPPRCLKCVDRCGKDFVHIPGSSSCLVFRK